MGRAPCCEKVGIKRGRWTAEEDQILSNYIQSNGEGSWRSLPKNAGLKRCGKSCRLRWINYLRSDLKRGNITPEEEELVVKLHSTLGNRYSINLLIFQTLFYLLCFSFFPIYIRSICFYALYRIIMISCRPSKWRFGIIRRLNYDYSLS
ncbi:hypothetical protein AXX17_AT2G45220 [Arabidopsis thaliana]|uniref:Uncharacterized protein n=1 Tax=Arabidopsis thaliana TaxID=3702 RepID=A0A178VXG6_ARATH|nr:hypothetical protein AXX17_AT2G45220 [Arabidopsis thaliana]